MVYFVGAKPHFLKKVPKRGIVVKLKTFGVHTNPFTISWGWTSSNLCSFQTLACFNVALPSVVCFFQ